MSYQWITDKNGNQRFVRSGDTRVERISEANPPRVVAAPRAAKPKAAAPKATAKPKAPAKPKQAKADG